MWYVGFGGKFPGHLVWACIFQGLLICYNKRKSLQRLMICVNEIYSIFFAKCITWTKKSKKGKQEWEKTCANLGLRLQKLNTPVKTR